MSIIIRLQNLPLSAKSGDIRRFFGGLRIPNGGVHIIGGEKGDAFIAFTSDEDARIAMRKDGSKILDTRIKLYLSSRMEMQHEIGRITTNERESTRQRSPDGRQISSRSPREELGDDYDRSYRSGSPIRERRREYSPYSNNRSPNRRSRSPRRRSRSPRRMSRSPRRWSRSPSEPRRSRSPIERSVMPSESSYKLDENLLKLEKIFGINRSSNDDISWKSKEFRREEKALLEQKIAEALTASLSNMGKMTELYHSPGQVESPINMQVGRNSQQFPPMEQSMMPYNPEYNSPMPVPDNRMFMPNMNMPGSFPTGGPPQQMPPFQHPVPPPNMPPPMMAMPPMNMPSIPPPVPMQAMPPPMPFVPPPAAMPLQNVPNNMPNPNLSLEGLFVTLSGLDPSWNLTEIQTMLKGAFIPQKSIRLEKNEMGANTGTAFVKLCNKDDFLQLISHSAYSYNNRLITVSDCPIFLAQRYFTPEMPTEGSLRSPKGCFYYRVAGLPYEACFELVLHFFEGLEVLDLYIVYSKATNGFRIQGKATGIAFVAFGNEADAQKALTRNLQHFLNTKRIVKLVSCTKRNMLEAKKINNDLLSQSTLFVPVKTSDNSAGPNVGSSEKRPLCTFLTGLPHNTNIYKIIGFFKPKSNPGFIHLLLNEEKKPNGRAFVEFETLQDFDEACRCHGKKIDNNVISVKQILFDEMRNSLESQRGLVYSHPPKNYNKDNSFSNEKSFPENNTSSRSHSNLAFPDRVSSFNSGPGNTKNWKEEVDRKKRQLEDQKRKIEEDERKKRQLEERKRKEEEERKRRELEQRKKREEELRKREEDERRKREEDERRKREIEIRKREEEERRKRELEEASRIPVKFEVKIKPAISKNVQIEDAFDSSSKADPKRKLSKLSPERPTILPPKKPATKIENKEQPKSKSPIKDIKKSDRGDSRSSSSKVETRDSRRPRQRSPDRSNGRRTNDDRRRSPTRSNYRRSPDRRRISRSPQRRVEYDRSYSSSEDYKEAVVQMTNVDPVIGSAELLDFFCEFQIDPDKIIRRIGERGELTGDVRVTFQNRRDANRAIRTLSRSYMNGLPIDMFLVN